VRDRRDGSVYIIAGSMVTVCLREGGRIIKYKRVLVLY
jgi:hypothetical protein